MRAYAIRVLRCPHPKTDGCTCPSKNGCWVLLPEAPMLTRITSAPRRSEATRFKSKGIAEAVAFEIVSKFPSGISRVAVRPVPVKKA